MLLLLQKAETGVQHLAPVGVCWCEVSLFLFGIFWFPSAEMFGKFVCGNLEEGMVWCVGFWWREVV